MLLGVSVVVWVWRRRFPYLLMGWLWFLGMLVPVIGLVQMSPAAMADRYTYLPSLGVLVLAVWGACELVQGKAEGRRQKAEDRGQTAEDSDTQHAPRNRVQSQIANRKSQILLWVAGSLAIVGCLVLTRQQLGYWQDGETLFRHALEVTENNYVAHNCLSVALLNKGQIDESITQSSQAIRLKPNDSLAYNNLGVALLRSGQTDEAIRQFQQALKLRPDYADARKNLTVALNARGDAVPPPGPAAKP
jgi:tetratricopeptide (TPR) repeat protein